MSGIEPIARAALAGALNSFWISLALAGAAWTLARCLPRTNAATRHLLWWAVLALVLIAPFSVARRGVVRSAARGPAVTAPRTPAPIAPALFPAPEAPRAIFPLRLPPGRWLRAAGVLWGLFALAQLLRIAWSFAYLYKVKRAAHAAPEALGERFRYWVAASGIHRPVRLLISRQVASPMATGFRHPAVILPAPLIDQFGERELDHALLHELAHVARRDDWTNLLARGLGAIAGLHPVAAWVLGRIARERELAADDWVVSRTGEVRPYAASLARLFELCRSQRRMALAAGMAGSRSHLGDRIEVLLDSGRHFSPRASLVRVAFTAMALLALVAAGARAPRWIVLAQSAPPAPARELPRPASAPVNPHGSFLAALVAAGYGNLSVDEIISLKDHGVNAQFLADISQSGWERMTAAELIELRNHGVPPEMLRALREAGLAHVEIREVVDAFAHGVRPETLRNAAQYGSRLSLAQIVKLKQAGVIP